MRKLGKSGNVQDRYAQDHALSACDSEDCKFAIALRTSIKVKRICRG